MTEDITPNDSQNKAKNGDSKGSLFERFKQWLLDSYNGIFKIVVQPLLPKLRLTMLVIIAFLVGMVFAYTLRPTKFFDAAPNQLSDGARDQWVIFVASSYDAGLYDVATTQGLLEEVESPSAVIQRLVTTETGQAQASLQRLQNEVMAGLGEGTPAPSNGNIISSILDFVLGIIFYLVVINLFAIIWGLLIGGYVERAAATIRKRIFGETEEDKRSREAIEGIKQRKALEEKMREESAKETATNPLGAPIMQRISPYQKGRAYDDSFAIEDENDMFLGECGATISKTIGDSQELAAVEIWVFDKDDFVKTYTKLFVSEHINNDPVARSELDAKVDNPATDIVVMSPGATIVIETNNIRCQAKVVDMGYGSTPGLPPNSHFENITLQMEAWELPKSGGASTPAPVPVPVPAASSGLPSLDSYEIGPPPQMPSTSTTGPTQPAPVPTPPPASPPGARPLDAYEIGPPPQMPSGLTPPSSTPNNDDDDPFGGTGDFTPINN